MIEEELILGLNKHLKWAQEEIYRRYYKRLKNWLKMKESQLSEEFIEECVNDAFLRIFAKIDLYSYNGQFFYWCCTILRNCMFSKWKAENKYMKKGQFYEKPRPLSTSEYHINAQVSIEDYIFNKLDLEFVEQHMQKTLSEKALNALKMNTLGYKHKEIAQYIDSTENTSKWYCAEAKKQLKKEFND